jgi:hypothetical protein
MQRPSPVVASSGQRQRSSSPAQNGFAEVLFDTIEPLGERRDSFRNELHPGFEALRDDIEMPSGVVEIDA